MKIAFLNPQGNFDSKDSYWTEHPDFGGQLVYVKEVAKAMAKTGVSVDIVTRQSYHWHIRITPRLSVEAGLELGSGMYINTVSPEMVADNLREQMYRA